MSKNVEIVVNGIEEFGKEHFEEEILNHFANSPKGVPSVMELVNDDVEEFIKEANLEMLFEIDDKEVQKKLLRKIMYFNYLQGLGNDKDTFMIKGLCKVLDLGKM